MDPDKPLSSEDLIKQARQSLESSGDDVQEMSEEMTEEAGDFLGDDVQQTSEQMTEEAGDFRGDDAEAEEVSALAEAEQTEIEPDVADPPLPPEPDFAYPQPKPRPISRPDRPRAEVEAPPQPVPDTPSETPFWRRFLWLIPVAVLGVGFLGSLFETSTPVLDVAVGDCFDDPGDGAIESIDIKDCAEPHDFEVFDVFDIADQSDSFPGTDALAERAFTECLDSFEGYVGTAYPDSVLWLLPMTPLEDSWQAGDREVACLLYESPDGGTSVSQATGTARDSKR